MPCTATHKFYISSNFYIGCARRSQRIYTRARNAADKQRSAGVLEKQGGSGSSTSSSSSSSADLELELEGAVGGPDSGWPAGEQGVRAFAEDGIVYAANNAETLQSAALLPAVLVGSVSVYLGIVALTGEMNVLPLVSQFLVASSAGVSSVASRATAVPSLVYKLLAAAAGAAFGLHATKRIVDATQTALRNAASYVFRSFCLLLAAFVLFLRITHA